jgi:hypothetical protein
MSKVRRASQGISIDERDDGLVLPPLDDADAARTLGDPE